MRYLSANGSSRDLCFALSRSAVDPMAYCSPNRKCYRWLKISYPWYRPPLEWRHRSEDGPSLGSLGLSQRPSCGGGALVPLVSPIAPVPAEAGRAALRFEVWHIYRRAQPLASEPAPGIVVPRGTAFISDGRTRRDKGCLPSPGSSKELESAFSHVDSKLRHKTLPFHVKQPTGLALQLQKPPQSQFIIRT